MGQKGQNFWWVAPVFTTAEIAYRRLKQALDPSLCVCNEGHLRINIANGTAIWFKSADKPDSLYGEDVFAAVLDEASRMKKESWYAVRSTLTATRGPIRIIGNVKGKRNWFYELARRAEAGEPRMSFHRIIAHDAVVAGVLEADEVEDARRLLPESVFRELYLAEASDDGSNPFGSEAIRACLGPLSSERPAWWGIDLAKSVDYTVMIGLDKQGRTCRFARYQQPWENTIQRISLALEKDRAPVLVDSTGVGDPVVERLQRDIGGIVEGYHFSSPSKQKLMEGLAVAIQKKEITYPEGPINLELDQFEYEYTRTGVRYTAPEGFHDDCVCALALAVARRGLKGGAESWARYARGGVIR